MPFQLYNEAREYLKVLELCAKYVKSGKKGVNTLLVKGTKVVTELSQSQEGDENEGKQS